MVESGTVVLIIAAAAGTLQCMCWIAFRDFQQSNRKDIWLDLYRPLHPSAIDLRLDAALHDAHDGFNICDVCNIENLKRSIFCTICGAPINDAPRKNSKDKIHAERLVSASHNQRHQARALKPKDWLRKVGAEGKWFWFRDNGGAGGAHTQGYVVQYPGGQLELHTENELVTKGNLHGAEQRRRATMNLEADCSPAGDVDLERTLTVAARDEDVDATLLF